MTSPDGPDLDVPAGDEEFSAGAVERMTMDYPAQMLAPDLPPVQVLEGPVPTGGPVTAAASGFVDGMDGYDVGGYSEEFGNIINEASVPGADLSVCVFDSGEAHISSLDDSGNRQPVSENLDPDQMREIADDLRDLLNAEPDTTSLEEGDGFESSRVFTAGDLTFALDSVGDVMVSRSSDGLHMFDLPPDQVDELADALETSADVWEHEFLEQDVADQVIVAAVGVSRKGLKSDRALRKYWVTDRDHKILWGTKGDFKRCVRHLRKYVRDPEGLCAEYHHDALGVWPGQEHKRVGLDVPVVAAGESGEMMRRHIVENSTGCGGRFAVMHGMTVEGCYPDMNAALVQLNALEADDADVGCGPNQHRMPDGRCMDDDKMPGYQPSLYSAGASTGELWHAVVHREGVSTGKRTWLPGSVSWRPTPFAMHQEVVSSAHGSTPVTVYVGNVLRMQRDGNTVHAWGDLDLDSTQGLEYARRLVDGYGGWPSFGPGSESMLYDVITDPARAQSEPDQIVFRDYRIGEFTSVSVPGQEGTYIEPLPALREALAARDPVVVAGAVRAHGTATSDEAWQADTQVGRLPSPVPARTARAMYAWVDDARVQDGQVVKDGCKFPHHLVSADGHPGAADLTACSSGIAALHGARGNTPAIPAADRQGVYNHLKAHLVDGGRDPKTVPSLNAAIVTAAGSWQLDIPELPPADWFVQPAAFPNGYAVTMSDRGEIVGLLAPRDVAHRTFARAGQRKTLRDIGRVDYSRWLKETPVEGGARMLAGPLVMECMHAPQRGYGTLDRRNQYYEDSCAVFARVAIGEIEAGTWIHGAALPGVSTEQAIKFLCCDVSGDWQPHPERAGWTEFVAVLAVPVGGWPKEKHQVSTTVRENADELVIAGAAVPVLFEPTVVLVDPRVIESIAANIGLDAGSRIRASAEKIAHLMGGKP